MADNTRDRGPEDGKRVNVNQDWEVKWWCNRFGCTEQQLRDAVRQAGVMADDVERQLRKR